jgi:hypothetical protein
MIRWLIVLPRLALAGLRSRHDSPLENLALRHQLLFLSRGFNRPAFRVATGEVEIPEPKSSGQRPSRKLPAPLACLDIP